MQTGFDVNQLIQEAQTRWLKPPEVLFILQNHEKYEITQEAPQKPPSGSLFLFNKRVLRFFRKDGYSWRKKKDGRTVGEAHERLKVGNAEALNCYYAHGEENPNFQRRSYWMLDPACDHIVLVHYREITDGRLSSGSNSENSPGPSSTFSQSPSTYTRQTQNPGSASLIDFHEPYQNQCSPGSIEVSSDAAMGKGVDFFNGSDGTGSLRMSSGDEVSQALRRLELQLSLDDDSLKEYAPVDDQDGNVDEYVVLDDQCFSGYAGVSSNASGSPSLQNSAFEIGSGQPKDLGIPSSKMYTATTDMSTLLLDPSFGMPLEVDSSLTVAKDQRFTIHEISPEWGFTDDSTKVIIIGSFLCDPSECMWHCMFGDIEVPLHIIQNGVLCCRAPPHSSGKVTLCVTSGNRESCSEIREFEYRDKHNPSAYCDKSEGETSRSTDELLLLVRFVQMLVSNPSLQQGDELGVSHKLKSNDDSWGQIIEALLFGGGTSSDTLDWLIQQLIQDKLQQWLSSRSMGGDHKDCCLSKKEQGIIHMIAGLGYEWALNLVLGCGVGINFRDINGWTALHWAARFGREKMVAALIASGASAVAVTDPSSQDPIGRTPAYIASTSGHKGLAGYLSELALTSHLSSLTLEESELSKGSADVEAELAVNHISQRSINSTEDQVSLKHTLAAVRNAAQAAARIQAAFRAHSFRKRLERDAVTSAAVLNADEYGFTAIDIQGLSKLAFRNLYDHNKAALSIQKNYRGWKGRKDFLALRQKVVKIQAHVRGYQVRKKYRVFCWAVGILDKAVLRWRRKGAGLRGFKPEPECIEEDEDDDDIVKVFRKEKVNVAIDEAVSRVLSMVDNPQARQQYHRMLGKYQEAKAELEGQTSEVALAFQGGVSNIDNDMLQFP